MAEVERILHPILELTMKDVVCAHEGCDSKGWVKKGNEVVCLRHINASVDNPLSPHGVLITNTNRGEILGAIKVSDLDAGRVFVDGKRVECPALGLHVGHRVGVLVFRPGMTLVDPRERGGPAR